MLHNLIVYCVFAVHFKKFLRFSQKQNTGAIDCKGQSCDVDEYMFLAVTQIVANSFSSAEFVTLKKVIIFAASGSMSSVIWSCLLETVLKLSARPI